MKVELPSPNLASILTTLATAGARVRTSSQAAALATVLRHGPLSPSELAEIERIKRPTATRIVRHLEEAGLVERVRDPEDGRASILSVTAEGRALLRRLRERKTAYLAKRLAAMDPDDRRTLERAADLLEGMLE